MNVLFLTSRPPFPPIGGDRVRTFQFIRYLKRRHRITIVTFVEREEQARAAASYRDLYDRFVPVTLPRSRSYLNCLLGLVSTKPLQAHYYESAQMRRVLAQEFAREKYDVVVCHMIRMVPYLDDIPVRTAVDLCDALSLFHRRSARVGAGFKPSALIHVIEAKRVLPYEIAAMNRAAVSIFISPVDADYCHRDGHGDRIAVVPNGVDADAFPFHPERRDDHRLVYMGNMRTFQNRDTVMYLVREILPLILKARADTVLHIVGNEPPASVRRLHDGQHVIVTGRVDSVIPCLAGAAVMVAPMRASAGVQNKILEALAVGTPVVTTPVGAEGLEPDVLTIADSPRELARATLDLMGDPVRRHALSLAGRAHIETRCTWEKALENLDAVLAGTAAAESVSRST